MTYADTSCTDYVYASDKLNGSEMLLITGTAARTAVIIGLSRSVRPRRNLERSAARNRKPIRRRQRVLYRISSHVR